MNKQSSISLQLKSKRTFFLISEKRQSLMTAWRKPTPLYLQLIKQHDRNVAPRPQRGVYSLC